MKLIDWRHAAGISRLQLALRLGCQWNTVRRYEVGERLPDAAMLARIHEVTGGKVTPNDFFLNTQEPAA